MKSAQVYYVAAFFTIFKYCGIKSFLLKITILLSIFFFFREF